MSTSLEKKTCTKCLAQLSLDNFYRKGNRLDSWCKECKKKKRRANHLVSKNELNKTDQDRLNKVVKIAIEHEIHQLKEINKEILAFINSRDPRGKQ